MKRKRKPKAVELSRESEPDEPARQEEPSPQTFKFRLRNGFVGMLRLPVKEIDRLWRKVQHPDDSYHFIVFDNESRRFALNIRHVVASQFDLVGEDGLEGELVDEDENLSDLYFSDSSEPLRLEVEPDVMTLAKFDKVQSADDDDCQVANFFFYLDSAHRGFDIAERLRISTGSTIWFRLDDLSFVSVPLRLFAEHQQGQQPED